MPQRSRAPWLTFFLIMVVTMLALEIEGRRWFCKCGQIRGWVTDIWTSHCSQHLSDPYTITHISHGLIFCGILALLRCRWPVAWQFNAAIATAALWEIVENTSLIIDRYRTVTMSLEYRGDSITNSLGDILACGVGFVVARRLGWRWALAIFVATELILLALIRDNLTLNVIMLIYPLPAIKSWQSAGHV